MTETISALMLTGDMTAGGAGVAGGAAAAAGAGADCCWTGAGVPHPTAASHVRVITTSATLNDSRAIGVPFQSVLRGQCAGVRWSTADGSTSSHVGADRPVQKSTSACRLIWWIGAVIRMFQRPSTRTAQERGRQHDDPRQEHSDVDAFHTPIHGVGRFA